VITEADLKCFKCGKAPEELDEYVDEAKYLNATDPDAKGRWTAGLYVMAEEGTLNQHTGEFACTDCYIKIGMPATSAGWKAGDPY
jgi:hypothetical protein